MKNFAVILALFLNFVSSPGARAFLSSDFSSLGAGQHPDAFASSVWGFVHNRLLRFERRPRHLKFQDPRIANALPADAWIWPDTRANPDLARPLVIIFPGTFSNEDYGQVSVVANSFLRKGYHVLSFPNPASPHYIAAGIHTHLLQISEEAQFFRHMIGRSLSYIGPQRVASIHLVGISYGGFLAAVMSAQDAMSSEPVFTRFPDSTLTILSPPVNFGFSIRRLDSYLDETSNEWGPRNSHIPPLKNILSVIFTKNPLAMAKTVVSRAKAIFSHFGFRIPACDLLDHYDRGWQLHRLKRERKAWRTWKSNLRIYPALRELSPEGYQFMSARNTSDLGYWLYQVSTRSRLRIQIAAATDDPLNVREQWYRNSYFSFPRHSALLPLGGHTGFMGHPQFSKILAQSIDAPFRRRQP